MVVALKYLDRKTSLEGILQSNKELFEPHESLSVKPTSPLNNLVKLFLPEPSRKSYRLRDNVGYLSGEELLRINNRNEVEGCLTYSYIFCLESILYFCTTGSIRKDGPFKYEIRYEHDISQDTHDHPKNHLHVIHELPRYRSEEMTFELFMEFIKVNFFDGARKTWISVPHWKRT